MGLGVGKVTIERLPRPAGLAHAFAVELAGKAISIGEGRAFGCYVRGEMEQRAREFAGGNPLSEHLLLDWIAGLPWDEQGCLILAFRW